MLFNLVAPFLLIFSALSGPIAHNKAQADVTLKSETDHFYLSDDSFTKEESFVYTSAANFASGQAAGLVFGAKEDTNYWVFNVDRRENRTKLLYFTYEEGKLKAKELFSDYIIGNDKVTQSELNLINPRLADNPRFHLKLVITVEEEKVYGEFFIDNIKRFGVDRKIDLNDLEENLTYEGGNIGFNVFNSEVKFNNTTVGKSDYSYYTELYRNKYHFSQFSHWNNDPNGLVYYKGYYHIFFQTNPYGKQWDGMYWGHARSKDLFHWQELPIALFPDDGTMGKGLENGWAWSGIAMVYHKGMSQTIDEQKWFANGEGLLGFYTRDGQRQDQVIICSDDEGITWTKKELISQHLIVPDRKVDCRDPSIIPLTKSGNKVTLWGMVLSGGVQDKIWYLVSEDLVSWRYAGGFDYVYPECATVAKVSTKEGETHYMMSISSRYYAIGDFSYNPYSREVSFTKPDGALIKQSDFKKMDYGEDSYAAQCFYIDDNESKYYGKSVSISWFSGLPSDAESGIYEKARDPWNGGGMTIPVILGLQKENGEYFLTQQPIVENNDTDLTKTEVVKVVGEDYKNETNLLANVSSHTFELSANFDNENNEDVEFRVCMDNDEYTSFGYTKTEGYYVDRSHTSDAGINFSKGYHGRFTTGPLDGSNLSFYVLCDDGGLEIFAGDYRYAFYNLTLSSPYATGATMKVTGNVYINSLYVNDIATTWHSEKLEEGTVLLNKDNLEMDLTLGSSKNIMAYSSNEEKITWTVTEGEDIVEVKEIPGGANVKALKNGEATITASTSTDSKTVSITVDNGEVDTFFTPKAEGVHSGEWLTSSKGLEGYQSRGDGFLFSDVEAYNATVTASFDLSNADAAGILLRASRDLSSYIMVNYDKVGRVCKVWSNNGEIGRCDKEAKDNSNVVLSAKIVDDMIEVSLNGEVVVASFLSGKEPTGGYLGLNVCTGRVIFSKVSLLKEEYEFENKDLAIVSSVTQHVKAIYNITNSNSLINESYYRVDGDNIIIAKEYFQLLKENQLYRFYIEGELNNFTIQVNVKNINYSYTFDDIEVVQGVDVTTFIGILNITSVKVNGSEVAYKIANYALTIQAKQFVVGDNEVTINDTYTFAVVVKEIEKGTSGNSGEKSQSSGCGGSIVATSILLSSISLLGASLLFISRRKRHGK